MKNELCSWWRVEKRETAKEQNYQIRKACGRLDRRKFPVFGNIWSGNPKTRGDERKKKRNEPLRRKRKLLKAKLCSRNLIQGIYKIGSILCKILRTILTMEKRGTQMDQRIRKLETITRPWWNGYHRRKWRHEFKSWTRLIAFHIALIPLGKVWIQ